jgi:hypothetical protein
MPFLVCPAPYLSLNSSFYICLGLFWFCNEKARRFEWRAFLSSSIVAILTVITGQFSLSFFLLECAG